MTTAAMIAITVNNSVLQVEEGENLLKALLAAGIRLPAVCFHPALHKTVGVCRLCTVEAAIPGEPPELKRACLVKAHTGLVIQTESVAIQAAREKAMRALLKQAPQSERLIQLAHEFGIRIDPAPDGCIRCLLCERVCKEVVKAGALKLGKRDGKRLIEPVEGRCIGCGTCANICPTHVILITDDENVRTISIRGGKLTGNCCQALARDILAHNLPAIQAAGYNVELLVHDEAITECPDTPEYNVADLSSMLSTNPPWSEGLPLAAAGIEAYRYKKD